MRHLALLLGLFACSEGGIYVDPGGAGAKEVPELGTPSKTDRIVQVVKPQVDILWVLDNSCSMSEEQVALATNFPEFIKYFLDSGLDWHIGLVSTDTEDPGQNGKLIGAGGYRYIDASTPNPQLVFAQMTQLGTGGSATERGLLAAYRALSQPTEAIRKQNKDFYRQGAALHVIVISDEEDQSAPEVRRNEFVTFMQDLKSDPDVPVSLSAIVGPLPSGCHSANGDAVPGSIYIGVANALGGLTRSICDEDWIPLLQELGLHAAGLRREYFLSEVPVPGTVEVWTVEKETRYDGVDRSQVTPTQSLQEICTANGGYVCFPFSYDETRNSVIIDGDYVPGPMAEVLIHYQLLSGLQPEDDEILGGGETDATP